MVVITSLIAWLIPDVPAKVKKQIRRETYIANEIVIKTEYEKARGHNLSDLLMGSYMAKFKKNDKNGSEVRKRGDENTTRTVIEDEVSVSNI